MTDLISKFAEIKQQIVNMSLFKSILKSVLNEVLSDNLPQREERPAKTVVTPQHQEEPLRQTIADYPAYFAEILSSEFPQYSIKRNVPVTELAGFVADEFQLYKTRPLQSYKAEWGAPYTFVLYRGGTPAGVVMLGSGSSHSRNVKYLIARMYAKKLGLPYINFYTQFPNERAYVVGRIREFLNA